MNETAGTIGDWAVDACERARAHMERALRRFEKKPSAKRVHRARKAAARLLAILEDFPACVDEEPALAPRVRALRKWLGKVRDADVHLQRLRAYRAASTLEEREAIERLRSAVARRKRKAENRLDAFLRVSQ